MIVVLAVILALLIVALLIVALLITLVVKVSRVHKTLVEGVSIQKVRKMIVLEVYTQYM